MSERLVMPGALSEEERYDVALRPRSLDRYVGQTRIVDNLRVFITAARQRGEPLDHVLLFGPPGLGKTTLANIIAHEMQVDLRSTSGPVIEKVGDLAAVLTNLDDDALLFIDEIHRLSAAIEEVLYPAMEDYQIDIIIGEGPSARSVKLPLPRFTLVGSTTRAALLTSPLRGRFGIVFSARLLLPGGACPNRRQLGGASRRRSRAGGWAGDRATFSRYPARGQSIASSSAGLRAGSGRRSN